jgi:hypothetical protein
MLAKTLLHCCGLCSPLINWSRIDQATTQRPQSRILRSLADSTALPNVQTVSCLSQEGTFSTHKHTHTHTHTHFMRETNEPTTNVDGHRQAVTRLWLQNTSSGHQNRESHVARHLSVARMVTRGARRMFIIPLGLIHGQPPPWAPNSRREGEGR